MDAGGENKLANVCVDAFYERCLFKYAVYTALTKLTILVNWMNNAISLAMFGSHLN